MLSINHSSNGQAVKDYFRSELTQSDYYMKDGQSITGEWQGLGSRLLGLQGRVDEQSYFRLCDNQHPETGEQLSARMKANRRVTYDFTFDAPKAVSLLYELGGDERILEAFRTSVQDTMAEVEKDMCVRVRKGGAFHDRVTGNMVWCDFTHRTTRPLADGIPDPQLHTHAVAMNLSYDAVEGHWKAGEFSAIKRDGAYYQAAFHSRLAGRLGELGYGVERADKAFHVLGIDRTLEEKFSRRTDVIEAEAQKKGITDAKQKAQLGRRTRNAKNEDLTISELRQRWNERLTPEERQSLRDACGNPKAAPVTAKQAMDHAIEHAFERESVVPERKLLTEALTYGVGSVGVEEARAELRRADVLLKEKGGVRYATTRDVYHEEAEMLAFARSGRGTCRKLARAADGLDAALSREQSEAAKMILNSRDRVMGLRGGAGTGKTRMMQATVTAIEKGGHKVFAFAPSAEASRGVLRKEGFAEADTLERLLTDEKLQQRVSGQVLWIDEAGLLSVRDTNRLFKLAKMEDCRIILAGDTRQHASVIRGDALRLIEQDAGVRFAELKEIRRQENLTYRDAVAAISQGDLPVKSGDGKLTTGLSKGIEALDGMGAIVECDGEERFSRIAADYLDAVAERKSDGSHKTALVVAPTHAEGEKVTACIRDGLKEKSLLSQREEVVEKLASENWTTAQRRDPLNYDAGLVVQFNQNARGFKRGEKAVVVGRQKGSVTVNRADGHKVALPLTQAERFQVYRSDRLRIAAGELVRITQNGYTQQSQRTGKAGRARLNNGSVYRVAGFTPKGDLRLENGFVVQKDYGHLAYGYTSTSHASQGKGVDKVMVAMGHDALAAANREQFYVSVSRGRESVRLYTDDKQAMLDSVRASGARLSATELLRDDTSAPKPKPHARLKRMMQAGRLRTHYEALRERARSWMTRSNIPKEKDHGRGL